MTRSAAASDAGTPGTGSPPASARPRSAPSFRYAWPTPTRPTPDEPAATTAPTRTTPARSTTRNCSSSSPATTAGPYRQPPTCLQEVLALCPAGARVAVWVRGERPNPRAGRPLNAWEPVIYHGGRILSDSSTRTSSDASSTTTAHATPQPTPEESRAPGGRRVDVLIRRPRPRTTAPGHVTGAKPAEFARWIFDLLGALPGDDLTDLYPGSGGITTAWTAYTSTPENHRMSEPREYTVLHPAVSDQSA